MRRRYKIIAAAVLTGLCCAEAYSQSLDVSRLRMENERLRAENDSLRRRLVLSLPEADPWQGLSGLDDYGAEEGTGKVSSIEGLYVQLASPCLDLDYQDVIIKYIERYLTTLGRNTSVAVGRYEYHKTFFVDIFDRYGVPAELTTLSIVESAVSTTAVSHAGAAGVWQLMPATARDYGLRVDGIIDERFDLEKSTHAAARYLHNTYEQLGSWPLAVMSYNCGIGNVRRGIVMVGGSGRPWDILAVLPEETRAYLPSLLAVNYITQFGREQEGFVARQWSPPATVTVRVGAELNMAEVAMRLGIQSDALRRLNPAVLTDRVPADYPIVIPSSKRKEMENYLKEL